MPTPSLEKAAAVAELSKKYGGVFAFVTNDANLLNLEKASVEIAKHSFAEYACNGCGTHFHSVAAEGFKPSCVTCGSETVVAKADAKVEIPSDSEMASMTCGSCGTHSVFRPELAAACDVIHCSVCGHGMKTKADLDAVDDTGPIPEVDELDLVDLDDSVGDELSETTQETPGADTSPPLTPDTVAPVTDTQELPSDKPSGELPPDAVDPNNTQQEPIDQKQVTGSEDGEEVMVDMTEDMGDDAELSFVLLGDSMHILASNKIVASLSEKDAGDNADIMQTAEFSRAVAHSIQTLGLKKAIAQYGFKPAKVKVKLTATIARKVEASVQEQAKHLEEAQKKLLDDVSQSIDIAAAGFAGNFWRNKTDPLKLAMAAELKSMGIRNSTQVVDRVFAAHALPQLRQIIELARELIQKPVEARNGLAQAIDLAKYQPMVTKADLDAESDDVDEEEEDDDNDVVAVATPVNEVASVTTKSPSKFRSSEIASILGDDLRLPFGN